MRSPGRYAIKAYAQRKTESSRPAAKPAARKETQADADVFGAEPDQADGFPSSRQACACGGTCPRCGGAPRVQAKLEVGRPGDPFETEADEAAERVMGAPAVAGTDDGPPTMTATGTAGSGGLVASRAAEELASRRGRGVPLPGDARAFFEPRFGRDFSGVRVHSDKAAQEMARSMRARAFTLGQDVYFAAGEFDAASRGGLRLLAHELAHTVQQGARPPSVVQRTEEDEAEEEVGEEAGEEYDPRTEALSMGAFTRRYPAIMRRLNDLADEMENLDADVQSFGPRGAGYSRLWDRYARARRHWAEANAALDSSWSIAQVMVVSGRAEQILVVVDEMKRAQSASGRSGFGAFAYSPLTTPQRRALAVFGRLRTALGRRDETRRVHEAVGEDIGRARRAREARAAEARLRTVPETVGDLRAYVRENYAAILEEGNRLQSALGVARLLHANLGDNPAAYVELFSRLESENPEFYALILFRGATLGYLGDMGVEGLDAHVYRDADSAGAHMLLGAWDFDDATGGERESPAWTLALDVLVGVIPFLGQAADVRDVTGYIYRLGRYSEQRSNPWTWVGAAGTLIGLIPAAGDAAKSLLAALRRAVTEVPVGRLSDDIVAAATRHMDGGAAARLLDSTDNLARTLTENWAAIQARALGYWDRILAELGPVLVRVSDLAEAELNIVRRAGREHMPEAMQLAGRWLGQLIQSAWVTAKLSARHEAEDILAMIREYREAWTLASDAARQLWSPTARFLAHLEPAERAAVRARLLELAAGESDEIAQGVRRMLGEEPDTGARAASDAAPPPARPPAADDTAAADGVASEAETHAVSEGPPAPRAGIPPAMLHGEMLDAFTRALRRPGPGREVYVVHDSIEGFDDLWRAASGDLMGDLPQGFVHDGVIHLPPNASEITALHEALHWATDQGENWGRSLLGVFVEEGFVESMARRIAGPDELGEVYEANVRFADELAQVVGQRTLDNALLHRQWGGLRRALDAHFGSEGLTEEFYALLRRIDDSGEPEEVLRRAQGMLAGVAEDATIPDARIPVAGPEAGIGGASRRPPFREPHSIMEDTVDDDLPEGIGSAIDEADDALPEGTHSFRDEPNAAMDEPRIPVSDPLASLERLPRIDDRSFAYVYRILNHDDQVIYYGISGEPVRRLRQHAASQGWADQIRNIEVINEAFPRPQALALETDLIRDARQQGFRIYNQVEDTVTQELGGRGGSFAGEIEVPADIAPWTRIE